MDQDPDVIEVPWVEAPTASHVARFRFVNRAFSDSGRPSELYVTFKGRKKPDVTYRYDFADHGLGRTYFERMTITEHPGEIVWEIRRLGIPYTGPL